MYTDQSALAKPKLLLKQLIGRITKQNPVYEMVPSVRQRQQFGLALAFKFIAE